MKRHLAGLTLLIACAAAPAAVNDTPQAKAHRDADAAWADGDYISALRGYLQILEGPGGDAFLEPIALQTGELFPSVELTPDGRNPKFSPDGRFIAYETGLEVARRTRVVRNDDALTAVADLPGVSATFSPASNAVAYLRIVETPELAAAARALDEAPLAARNRSALIQALSYQVVRSNVIVIRDLSTGQEREIAAPGLFKTALTYSMDGRDLYFLGAALDDASRNDIYVVAEGQAPRRLSDAPGFKSAPIVADGAVIYARVGQNPFRAPQPPGGGGGRGGGQAPPPSFGVIDRAGSTRIIEGTAPTVSADGRTLAYVTRAGDEQRLMVGPVLGSHAAIRTGRERLDAPALAPDGSRVAVQVMARDDWEIHVIERAAHGEPRESRLTRDNQHDVLPRFVTADRLLAVVGEARHRRSFLYNLMTGERTRVFHNNTVRTIAPEYQWVASADGKSLLIGAERDGDTVSPARGVYRLRLDAKIGKADLTARLRANLASETALRAHAERVYGPIHADVKKVVDAVSVSRIYGYEKALFEFDSKHISRPGNKKAAEYLFAAYKSFGYEPEYQWFKQENALGGQTANVIATLRGTVNPELVYVVSSHYDSVAAGPGADDDSSGTAALLEAARVLAGHPMPATIVFASFTAEEAGLLGSREYVRRAVESGTRIVGALNNDMIGFSNDQRLDNTIRYSNPGIRDIQHGAAMLFTRLITYDALYFKSTDAAAYYDAYGDIVGGIGSHPVLSNPHYHQPHDLLEFINHQLVAETSKTTVATLMLLASSPSRLTGLKVDRSGSGVAVSWDASPEKDVTSYTVSYGPAEGPEAGRRTVKGTSLSLPSLPAGTVVAVKAVNARGLEGWDWARATVP